MYYPYLRGKQFELLALRGIETLLSSSNNKISPIIEPVRDSSTLRGALKSLCKMDINFTLIINPSVGELSKKEDIDNIIKIFEDEDISGFTNYEVGVLIENDNLDYYRYIMEKVRDSKISFNGYTLIHNKVQNDIKSISGIFTAHKAIANNVINLTKTNSDRRYNKNFSETISLDDYFQSLDRNSDYLHTTTSTFGDEYRHYAGDGYKGFGDFLTIGDNYSEGGFSPRAVAIHITYMEGNKIVVKHCVSDSNEDVSDVAGKFAEANKKLITRIKAKGITETVALKEFIELDKSQHFPGLGVIKKLSIMNHIELLIRLV